MQSSAFDFSIRTLPLVWSSEGQEALGFSFWDDNSWF
jgi:hypothetical protein